MHNRNNKKCRLKAISFGVNYFDRYFVLWQVDSSQRVIVNIYSQTVAKLVTGYSQLFSDIQVTLKAFNSRLHKWVVFDSFLNGFRGVYDGGVITAPKLIADAGK